MSDDKSFIAKIVKFILKVTKPDYMDNSDKISEFLSKKPKVEKPVNSVFKSVDFKGMQVFAFGDENAKNVIVFMHGGAYVNEINYGYCK